MNKSIASTQGQKNKRYSVKKPSIAHFFVSQSRLTDAVSVIFGELLSYEHPPKLRGIFYCCFPEKQELGAPLVARTARVFQAVKKTLVGAGIARPCPFVCEITSPEKALLRQVGGRPMVAPTHSIGQECDFLTR